MLLVSFYTHENIGKPDSFMMVVPISNQFTDLLYESMDWWLYDRDFMKELCFLIFSGDIERH